MEETTAPRLAQVEFTGNAGEYFKIWIVNVALTLVTLGVYSAWAKVRTLRYFYGNTHADGHRFEYLADPLPILKGRIIAVVALAAYYTVWQFYPTQGLYALGVLLLLLPAVFVLAVGFQLRNTAYRNIQFDFERNYLEAYGLLLGPLLIVATLTWILFMWWSGTDMAATMASGEQGAPVGARELLPTFFILALSPLMPYLDFLRARFTASHACYGSKRMAFTAGAWQFYALNFMTALVFMPLMLVAAIVAAIIMAATQSPEQAEAAARGEAASTMVFVIVGVFYAVSFFAWGYYRSRRTNLVYNSLTIGSNGVDSRLGARWLGWLYLSNTVAIIATLGLLIPWARVRFARYVAACTVLELNDIESVTASRRDPRTAVGEEVGDAFGFEVGF